MRRGQIASDEEAEGHARTAMWGALHGGAMRIEADARRVTQWGIYGIVAGGIAYAVSPIYRGLTVPFKAYLQMSCMTVGGCLEAERRGHEYGLAARRQRRMLKEQELWRMYGDEYRASLADTRAEHDTRAGDTRSGSKEMATTRTTERGTGAGDSER